MNLLGAPWEQRRVAKRSFLETLVKRFTLVDRFYSGAIRGFDADAYRITPTSGAIALIKDRQPFAAFIFPSAHPSEYYGNGQAGFSPTKRKILEELNKFFNTCRLTEDKLSACKELEYIQKMSTDDTIPLIIEIDSFKDSYKMIAYDQVFCGKFSRNYWLVDCNDVDLNFFITSILHEHFLKKHGIDAPPPFSHCLAALGTIYENPSIEPELILEVMLKDGNAGHEWLIEYAYDKRVRDAFIEIVKGMPADMAVSLHGVELASL